MRKMRGVGQLALASADPLRVAEFYESAFGFNRRAADETGVDLELAGFELSFRRAETPNRDGLQIGFRLDTAGEVDAWAQELTQRGFAVVAPPSGDRWEGM
ncbi:MAG TPA: VOC family protein, partial [Candidatus Limnocylindria bacterium]|nr:VOC family protein [Candidatus Limnocylindria bacterium]